MKDFFCIALQQLSTLRLDLLHAGVSSTMFSHHGGAGQCWGNTCMHMNTESQSQSMCLVTDVLTAAGRMNHFFLGELFSGAPLGLACSFSFLSL
jgi:hypothetical protein